MALHLGFRGPGHKSRVGAAGGAAAAFAPSDLASLTAWFDGDEFTGTPDTTQIATWTDQEGANDATQGTAASRPTVDATGLNSMAVVDFDGSADHFVLPDFVSAYTSGSAFFVANRDVDPAAGGGSAGAVLGFFGTGSEPHYPFTDGVIYENFGSTVRKTVGNVATSLATWHIGNFNSAANAWSFFMNGTSEFSTGTNTVAFSTGPIIGSNNLTAFWPGKVAEILIFNAVLSQSDREKVEGYLAHRWGIESVLPAPHPYKSSPP
jgi:hypothetical protein